MEYRGIDFRSAVWANKHFNKKVRRRHPNFGPEFGIIEERNNNGYPHFVFVFGSNRSELDITLDDIMALDWEQEPQTEWEPIHYTHDVQICVPVYQKNPPEVSSPAFRYDFSMACSDEQSVASMEPDYILRLFGHFDATTKSFKLEKK